MDQDALDLEQVTPATFDAAVGDLFRHRHDPVPFTLSAVRSLPGMPGQPREQPFALEFSRPGQAVSQGTVRLHHDGIGTLEIFLVPVAIDDGIVTYEAVFN